MSTEADIQMQFAALVERAADTIMAAAPTGEEAADTIEIYSAIVELLRTLAPDAGVKALAALRKERDDWKAVSETLSEMWEGEKQRAENAEADRDRLAAELAEARAQVKALHEAVREARDAAHSVAHDEYDGVWTEQDFREFTPLADAALAAAEGAKG